jgi:hypothetical protein
VREQHDALEEAARHLTRFRATGYRDIALDLYGALDELIEAMVGKESETWNGNDLEMLESAAKCICGVFGVGYTLNENIMIHWEI